MSALRILHLYPEQLGVSGDGGNVVTLAERARRAEVDVEILPHRIGDTLPADPDLVVIGSGPLSSLRVVHDDLTRFTSALSDWSDSGVPLVAVGGGMEILSDEIVDESGTSLEGLGFFAGRAVRGATRRANYFSVTTTYGGASLAVLGFEDHATRFELGASALAFGSVVHGGGNGDGTEGIMRDASFGTQLKGPVLPLNPELTDRVLVAALARTGRHYATTAAHARLDDYARRAREVISDNLEHAFKSM